MKSDPESSLETHPDKSEPLYTLSVISRHMIRPFILTGKLQRI